MKQFQTRFIFLLRRVLISKTRIVEDEPTLCLWNAVGVRTGLIFFDSNPPSPGLAEQRCPSILGFLLGWVHSGCRPSLSVDIFKIFKKNWNCTLSKWDLNFWSTKNTGFSWKAWLTRKCISMVKIMTSDSPSYCLVKTSTIVISLIRYTTNQIRVNKQLTKDENREVESKALL